MNLGNWFNSSIGASLRLAEDCLLASLLGELAGEVVVCATMLQRFEPGYPQVSAPLRVNHRLGSLQAMAACDTQVVGCLSAMPYKTGAVNAFVLQHGLEAEPDHLACIAEISRVLGEGGRAMVFKLDPWGGIGIRYLLGKLPRTRLIDPLAVDCARLFTAGFLRRAFAREGLCCERQRRIYGTRVTATLTELRKQRPGADLLDKGARPPLADDLALVGVTSRTSRGSEA